MEKSAGAARASASPLSIAIVTHGLFPFTVGGIERHTARLAEHLGRLGARVTVLTPEPAASAPAGAHYAVLPLGVGPEGRYFTTTRRAEAEALTALRGGDYDVVYAQGMTCYRYVASRSRAPVIWNPHGLEMFRGTELLHDLRVLPYRYRYRRLAHRAERVVSLGGRLTDELATRLAVSPDRLVVLPNAVELEAEETPATPATRSASELLFVGRLARNKGADLLIDAMNALANEDVSLTLVGDGPLRAELERRATSPRVRFLGGVGEAELGELFATAAALVLPSRFEGMPTVVLEAMAARLPVIATDIGAVRTMIEPGRTGLLIPPDSKDALVGAIRAFRRMPEPERRALSDAARAHVATNLSWPVVAKQTLALATTLAGRG